MPSAPLALRSSCPPSLLQASRDTFDVDRIDVTEEPI
jgi:hypothetical protein